MKYTVISLVTIVGLVFSSPTPVTPPPPGQTYITGYPICAQPGFTEVPGNYTESYYQTTNSTLHICIDACRLNATITAAEVLTGHGEKQPDGTWGGCESIAFSPRYGECLFYDRVVEGTQLINFTDVVSNFVHYDLICPVF